MFRKFFKKTKEKANEVINTTKVRVEQVADAADKFISEGNNQMKIITCTVVVFGVVNIISNVISIYANIKSVNINSTSVPHQVINNIYINGVKK